jgi:hypothetical protein
MNLGQKAKQVLGTLAPMLGTAIGGPFGALAGAALSQALGVSADDQKSTEAALLSASPDTLLKVKEAEQDFTLKMRELGISEDKLIFDDIANARGREIALKDQTPAILAYTITVGFFGTLGFMLWFGKPAVGGDALLVMLGSLGTAWAGVVAYYFGSSSGSARKDATISDIAKQT